MFLDRKYPTESGSFKVKGPVLHFYIPYGIVSKDMILFDGFTEKTQRDDRISGNIYGRMKNMRNYKKFCLAAGIAVISLLAAGCQSSASGVSSAPAVPLAQLRDEVVLPDTEGADIELLNLEKPIDYCYSSYNTDMIFKLKDGVWVDGLDSAIPIDQDRFQAMADNFLKLRAVSKAENSGDLDSFGLSSPAYTIYITDGGKGEVNISIGNQDDSGNYYVTLDESNVYTVKSSVVDSMVFDYDTLVIRDSLDLSLTADDIKKASVTKGGKTTNYKTSDKEAMARIAEGLSQLKPSEFASFHAVNQELEAAELSEDKRLTLNAEINNGGETQSITVYVGTFVDVMGERRYVQIVGSRMIAMVDSSIVGNLLNLTDEENSIQ